MTIEVGFIFVALVVVFLGAGVWIFSALMLVGAGAMYFLLGFPIDRIGNIAARVIGSSAVSWELAAIPMFIWMGDILFRTDIADRLFRGLTPMVRHVPGGLLHTNVLGCTLFAAVSGSSAATTATVGKITLPQLSGRGYNHGMASGSLAGAGSFGLLIPPSIALIIYGVLAEASISRLFAAGILPGIMIAGMFSLYIGIRALANPDLAPKDGKPTSVREVLRGVVDLLPIGVLMIVVLGSIYSGLATPSEAAAVGVFGAVILTVVTRQFSFSLITESLMSSIRISTMMMALIAASSFLSAAIAYMHLPGAISQMISDANLGPYVLLVVLAAFYLVLGMFLDGTSMTVMTVPIALPLVVAAGYDPIWFGIFLILMIEMGCITPPVGINLFIIQGLTKDKLGRVVRDTVPFFLLMCTGVALLAIFPEIVSWLPSVLFGR